MISYIYLLRNPWLQLLLTKSVKLVAVNWWSNTQHCSTTWPATSTCPASTSALWRTCWGAHPSFRVSSEETVMVSHPTIPHCFKDDQRLGTPLTTSSGTGATAAGSMS